jgi:hypothetical protein
MEKLILNRDQKISELKIEFGDLESALDSKSHHVLTESKIDLLDQLSQHLLPEN